MTTEVNRHRFPIVEPDEAAGVDGVRIDERGAPVEVVRKNVRHLHSSRS